MTQQPAPAHEGREPDLPGTRPRLLERVAPEGTSRRAHLRASRILAQKMEALVASGIRTADEALLEYRRMTDSGPRRTTYRQWSREHGPTKVELQAQRRLSSKATSPTRFLVVVDDRAGRSVGSTISSLLRQSWEHWQAVIVGDHVEVESRDSRITTERVSGRVVQDVLNAIVGRMETDFLLFLRAGDELAPNCLFSLYEAVWADPIVDVITFDDDVIGAYGTRSDPRFRPAWSPDMLLGSDYVDQAFALRRTRFLEVGGMQRDGNRAGFWELLLRCGPDGTQASSVSEILLHRGHPRDERVSEAGLEVVRAHLRSQGLPATGVATDRCVRIDWTLPAWPSVSIIIPTRHNRQMVSRLLTTLRTTDYPSTFDVTIVDNGAETPENRSWYNQFAESLNLRVRWWAEPFNYSRVNNLAARSTTGEVLVFLNDDMEVLDGSWLREVVGWAVQPRIGMAGLMLLDDAGRVQHAGAVLGLGGFADHLFQGMDPGAQTMFGPVARYRDVLAVTGACLAIRRERFDAWGGFDENFELCGSDVALGLSAAIDGYRTVCSPFGTLRHSESVTRGTAVPTCDFFASYWRYSPWLFGGDPYFSPNLSRGSRVPALARRSDPTPGDRLEAPLGRRFTVFRQRGGAEEAEALAELCRARPADAAAVLSLHAANGSPMSVDVVNWFIPELDSPFYGGINTALRIAAHLATNHGVKNNFVLWGGGSTEFVSSGIAAAFPSLRGSSLTLIRDFSPPELQKIPDADVGIATLWVTAYGLALSPGMKRKFYLIQDFEPMFYPAGTQYALAEETYRLGLYGLCNTENLARIYRSDYGGKSVSFMPAVDTSVFHADGRPVRRPEDPVTVFVYARPGHWRNCWELAQPALRQLKERLGDRVRILTAGSWAIPEGQAGGMRHLGLLDYRATGQLYRRCDVGLALTVSKHPSYLPLELMACGVPVVAFDNPWGHWILRDGENCLLADRTVDDLADRLERLCVDEELRHRLQRQGLADISERHSSWDRALHGIYEALCDPEAAADQAAAAANNGNGGPPVTRPLSVP